MSLATLKYLLIAIGLFYLILPRDLIPDAAGLIGRIDDAIVIAYLIRFYRLRKLATKTGKEEKLSDRETSTGDKRQGRAESEQASQESHSAKPNEDPYSVLGISRNATPAEVTAAYRQEAAKYHPDKVSHLGEELQKLAHERMLAISKAYEELRN